MNIVINPFTLISILFFGVLIDTLNLQGGIDLPSLNRAKPHRYNHY